MAVGLRHLQFLKFPDKRCGLAPPPQTRREEGPEL